MSVVPPFPSEASPLFYRLNADQQPIATTLEDLYSGPQPSACWLIGGGPSLGGLPCEEISRSPAPKMCVNLSGAGCVRPTFWTSYDPTARFHRSIYLDPGVLKFVHRRRAMDLVPESTFKVCECPGTILFDRDSGRGFGDFLNPAAKGIVDWMDSMAQAIDILFRLGFRKVYLAGCDMQIQPTASQVDLATSAGVQPSDWSSLADFVQACQSQGLSLEQLAAAGEVAAYHFSSGKSLADAVRNDQHYFRIAQCLRLSRRCLTQQGLQLISVTPGSRINDYFPYLEIHDALTDIHSHVGNPREETTRDLYSQRAERWSSALRPMRDIKPPNWQPSEKPGPNRPWPPVGSPPKRLSSTVLQTPQELVVEGEGWQMAERRFIDAYQVPCEEG